MTRLMMTAAAAGLVAACATSGGATEEAALPPYEPPATLAEATEGVSQVALFEVGDDDTTVYMMGTVHILRPDVAWKTAAYEKAFAAADAIYLEADTSDAVMAELQPLVMAEAMNPEGVTLSSYFTPEERAELEAALSEVGVPLAALEGMRPWFASLNLGVIGIQKLGGDPNAGVEKLIEADAAAAGKEMRSLETARQQIEILVGVPDEAWADALVADLDDFADFEGYFARLVGAWYDGRMDVVGEIMNDGMRAAPALGEAILFDRNEDWAAQIAELIETEPGTFLVAVGAGHLGGERSVQDYLEDEGYTVERAD